MTTQDGQAVLDHAVAAAVEEFGTTLSAAYALGSLAHGGFAPLVSDVDLMLVLDTVDESTPSRMDELRARVRRDEATELAERLSVFWSDRPGVQVGVGPHGRLPEVDRLDLLDSGRLLYGQDRRDGAERPTAAALVRQAAEFTLHKFDDDYLVRLGRPDALLAGGPRPVTKAVLFPARFLYTLDTGRIGRNDDAARWFPAHHPHGELVTAAMTWRTDGITDPDAARELLARHLVALHVLFGREYARALDTAALRDLATRLTAWTDRLAALSGEPTA